MKSEEEVEGYTLEEFHALLALLADIKPEYREFIEKYFADDMTPKQRLEYIEKTIKANKQEAHTRWSV
jgi:hypothetical protein